MDIDPKILFPNIKDIEKNLDGARERIKNSTIKIEDLKSGVKEDDSGRIVCDIDKYREEAEKEAEQTALEWHKNNPHIRLDDCGFPKDRAIHNFVLNHDFKELLTSNRYQLSCDKWVYLEGHYGAGKTSLAIRIMWEEMKVKPTLRPSWLSINHWVNSLMPDEVTESLATLRKYVVVDDFDKFSLKSEFQGRSILRLVEHLAYGSRKVVFTANSSLADLKSKAEKFDNYDLVLAIDRIRGKSVEFCDFPKRSMR